RRRQYEAVLRGGGGADDESPRSDSASAGEADHVVAGGRDSGDFGPQHAAVAGTLPEARLRWAVGPATGKAESKAGAGRDGRKGAGALSGEIFRPQRATLPREIKGEHGMGLSYTWVKLALQGAGLVKKGRKRGTHRKRRPRRPLPGMLLHLDGSRHRWFQDERWHDFLVILDDATTEIYYAQLVEEESTRTVMVALKDVVERKGLFCALYSDRASHFFETPKAGQKV